MSGYESENNRLREQLHTLKQLIKKIDAKNKGYVERINNLQGIFDEGNEKIKNHINKFNSIS